MDDSLLTKGNVFGREVRRTARFCRWGLTLGHPRNAISGFKGKIILVRTSIFLCAINFGGGRGHFISSALLLETYVAKRKLTYVVSQCSLTGKGRIFAAQMFLLIVKKCTWLVLPPYRLPLLPLLFQRETEWLFGQHI